MAQHQLMLPSKVTEITDINIIKNIYFPKLVTTVPFGLRVLITNTTVLYYNEIESKLVEIANTFALTDLFVDICYQCDKYNCTIDAILAPKHVSLDWLVYNLNKEKGVDTISTDDVDIVLIDMNLLSSGLSNFETRIDKLKVINEELSVSNVSIAKYATVLDITDLLTYAQSKLILNSTNSVHIRSISSMYSNSLAYSRADSVTVYSPFIELRCNFILKGTVKNINYTTVKSDYCLYKGKFKVDIATSLDVLFNNTIIKVDILGDSNSEGTTITKLFIDNKKLLIDKPVLFTGFVLGTSDTTPIGSTFLTFT